MNSLMACSSLKDTCASLENCGFTPLPRDREVLEPLTYKTDHLLPRFLHIMPSVREDLVESPLIQNHHIVMQVISVFIFWSEEMWVPN
jgi:hypothetical protein